METLNDLAVTDVLDEESLKDLYDNFGKESLTRTFRQHSAVARMLMEDPGTFRMLEMVYTSQVLTESIDKYILGGLPAQALRDRLTAVIAYLDKTVRGMIAQKPGMPIRIVNLGSGSARDIISVMAQNSGAFKSVSADCVDTDLEALAVAEKLAEGKGVRSSLNLISGNLTSLAYQRELDLGVLVGVLCGLDHRKCVIILKKIRRYFKEGGILIASNVTTNMVEQEPFFSRVALGEIVGWRLVFKTTDELRSIFEEAGYKWVDVFYDEPTRFHAMGVGMV